VRLGRGATRKPGRAARLAAGLALALAACGGGSDGAEESAPSEPAAPTGELVARDAWVTPPASGRGPAGGFLTLANGSARERRVVAVSSPETGPIELHRSWIEGGVARMAPVEALVVGPGETLSLEPGGHHLMIFEAGSLAPGDTVTLRLELADGDARELVATVRDAADPTAHEHDAH